MSRRNTPEIKIVYPDASEAAMLLTEAMIKRSSGKRVVETNSEEREYTGQELFAGALACKTDTSVELTLRLNPDAMDYALTTLIARNLTENEKAAIRAATDSMEVEDLLSPAQAAKAPGQALDGRSSADVPSAEREVATQSGGQKEKIEIGKISDKELRKILTDLIVSMNEGTETETAIEDAINAINYEAGVIDLEETYEPETDQNMTRLLAVLLYAAPDPDWDRDDISNFADVVFTTANNTQQKFVDIGTLCKLMAEAEYIATEMKSDATTHGILERLEKQEGELAKQKPEKADARRQIAQALAALIYWVPRNLNNKKQRDSIQMACIHLWRCMEKYPAALILAREIANSLNHIATEVDNGYKPSDIYNCIEREITGCWAGAIPEFEKEKILVFPDMQDKAEDNKSNDPSDTADDGELGLDEDQDKTGFQFKPKNGKGCGGCSNYHPEEHSCEILGNSIKSNYYCNSWNQKQQKGREE